MSRHSTCRGEPGGAGGQAARQRHSSPPAAPRYSRCRPSATAGSRPCRVPAARRPRRTVPGSTAPGSAPARGHTAGRSSAAPPGSARTMVPGLPCCDLRRSDPPLSRSGSTRASGTGWMASSPLGTTSDGKRGSCSPAEPHPAWTSGTEPYHPCQALPGLCPAGFLPSTRAVPTRGQRGNSAAPQPLGARVGPAARASPSPPLSPAEDARTWQALAAGRSLFANSPVCSGQAPDPGLGLLAAVPPPRQGAGPTGPRGHALAKASAPRAGATRAGDRGGCAR